MASIHTHSAHPAHQETSFFAKPNFIKAQRVTALFLATVGLLSTSLAPVTAGATTAIAYPLVHAGCALLGASLIQQVVGEAPGCEHGKVKRVVAGILMIAAGPLGLLIGSFFWVASNDDNARRAHGSYF